MTFQQVSGASWRGAADAGRANGKLFVLTLLALMVLAFVLRGITPPVFSALCMIAVRRFILLGESGAVFADRQRQLRFAGMLILRRLAFQMPSVPLWPRNYSVNSAALPACRQSRVPMAYFSRASSHS